MQQKEKKTHEFLFFCVHGKDHLPYAAYLNTQFSLDLHFMVASTFSWSSQTSFIALISLFYYYFKFFSCTLSNPLA
jgi:hypothetical protein